MHPSASFSAPIRVRIENHARCLRAPRRRDRRGPAASSAPSTSSASRERGDARRHRLAATTPTRRRIVAAIARARRRRGRARLRPDVPAPSRRQDRGAPSCRSRAATISRWSTRPGVARVCMAIRDDPETVWNLTIKRNTRRGRHRRHGRARARRHRPGGGAAGDGGQGDALQGVRRHRRLPALPRHEGPGRDRRAPCRRSRPVFGGINLEDISAPRCFEIEQRLRERSTSRSSTTTSTARRSSCSPR